MNIKKNTLLTLLLITLNIFGQVDDTFIRQEVLGANIKDSLYVFGKWNETDGTETHLKYLGVIKTEKEDFKIMTSSWYWGLSKRATSRILVFTSDNKYLGNYYVGMTYDLPEKIENNQIVFLHSECNKCDKNVITRLAFEDRIPEEFFLECKDGYGDFYSFAKE